MINIGKKEVKGSFENRIWVYISLTLSIVAFVIAIYILYCNKEFYEQNEFTYNPDSVVVGAFGLIVTLLVGWQIYKSVEVDIRDILIH